MGIVDAIMTGKDVERNGSIIINHIDGAVYMDIERVSAEEVREIANYKEWIESIRAEIKRGE
jgi:3-mercaptopyruvate sulfurtransferase SseA